MMTRGAIACLARLAEGQHRAELVFVGYAGEAKELVRLGFATMHNGILRITLAGVAALEKDQS